MLLTKEGREEIYHLKYTLGDSKHYQKHDTLGVYGRKDKLKIKKNIGTIDSINVQYCGFRTIRKPSTSPPDIHQKMK